MIPPRDQGPGSPQQAGGAPGETAGRTGLYFCRCGPNLGSVVRLGELEDPAAWAGTADVATHSVLCSGEGKAWLARRIREHGLERVVVAACSPREHEHTFRGVLAAEGRSPFHLQMVNLREQVEWIGGDPGDATRRSRQLVRAALRRVALQRALPAEDVEVSADVLVVGAGAAGISAALALAGKDRKVVVAEREFVVGGLANQLDEIFPALECASCFMDPAIDRLLHHDRVEVLTGAEMVRVRGVEGRFEVDLALRPRGVDPAICLGCNECGSACPVEIADRLAGGLSTRRAIGIPYAGCLPHASVLDASACIRSRGQACDLCAKACAFGAVRLDEAPRTRTALVGAIVLATGMRPGEVRGPDGVVSSYQLERMLHPNGPTSGVIRGARGKEPRSVLIATTAGEGEEADLAVEEILKLAHLVRARLPGARVALAGGLEAIPRIARRAAALAAEGVELVPGQIVPDGVAKAGDALAVPLSRGGSRTVRHADLVVVHAPARPAEGTDALARLLRIGRGEAGFLLDQASSPFEPTATRIAGVYVVGAAAGPRSIPQAIRDGKAAAGLVLASLVAGERKALEPLAAEIDAALCGACGICVSTCPFGAVVMEAAPRRGARVEAVHCRGCGICAAACPTGAANARHFTRAQISAEISGLLAGGHGGRAATFEDGALRAPGPPLAPGQPHPAAPPLASASGRGG